MGTYRAPGQVIDNSYQVANQQVAAGINKYDKLFAIRKEEQKVQMEKNAKLQEKQELDRVNGYNKFNTELRRVRPDGGFIDNTTPFVDKLAGEYASLYGKTDPDSLKRMSQIMNIPVQLAEGQGAMRALDGKYSSSLTMEKGSPNSVDYTSSNNDNLEYMVNYHNNTGKITPQEINGQISWGLGGRTLNNSAFVNGAKEGQDFIKYNGDISTVMGGTIEGIQASLKYQERGKEEINKTNPLLHTKGVSYKDVNEEYKNQLKNFNYDKTLSNQKYMSSIFPQLVNKVQDAAVDKDSDAAKLLYGADGVAGGKDENADREDLLDLINVDANAQVGPWVGSDGEFSVSALQKEIAKAGFYQYGTSDQYMKPDFVKTQETKLAPKVSKNNNGNNDSQYTKTQLNKINNKQNKQAYKDNLKFSSQIAAVSKVNRVGAIKKLAGKINDINKLESSSKNPLQKGTYMYDKEEDGLEIGRASCRERV